MKQKYTLDFIRTLRAVDSSGSSTVYLGDDVIFQQYRSTQVFQRILVFVKKLTEQGQVSKRVLFQKGFGPNKTVFLDKNIIIPCFQYICSYVGTMEDNIIVWDKIIPLNSFKKDLKSFLIKNVFKILYDISKALAVLHSNGIIHNDCSIDNIGMKIYKGEQNFCLYDFDGSGTPEEKGKNFDIDFKSLSASFEFHTDLQLKNFNGIGSVIELYSKTKDVSFLDSYNALESMHVTTATEEEKF